MQKVDTFTVQNKKNMIWCKLKKAADKTDTSQLLETKCHHHPKACGFQIYKTEEKREG